LKISYEHPYEPEPWDEAFYKEKFRRVAIQSTLATSERIYGFVKVAITEYALVLAFAMTALFSPTFVTKILEVVKRL